MRNTEEGEAGQETEMYGNDMAKAVKRLQDARMSLMEKQPFYAALLFHMVFSLDPMCETAYTDGEHIVFCPEFLEALSDKELEFVLMHEVMHAALDHCGRGLDSYDFDDFGTACDIVVNSNILYSSGMDIEAITLKEYGTGMHLTPLEDEGYLYTAEEVYDMIREAAPPQRQNGGERENGGKQTGTPTGGKQENGVKQTGTPDGGAADGSDALPQVRCDGGFDDHTYWGESADVPESVQGEEYNGDGESSAKPADMRAAWLQRMVEAAGTAQQRFEKSDEKSGGGIPLAAKRLLKELTEPQLDWRTVLDMFVQEEITDYSFDPPDRRFQESIFLLPDHNKREETVKDILFMIDTSGSVSSDMIDRAYSEIKGALEQFRGHLTGWVGFFDMAVTPPARFENEEEFMKISPKGGGGTSFECIFKYIERHSEEFDPASIIILTDGMAWFPPEDAARGIPVLWLINNDTVLPPWGRVARIT